MRYISFVLFLVLVGCPKQPTVPSAEDGGELFCYEAEQHLLGALNCRDTRGRRIGAPNLRGVSFAEVCRDMYLHGVNFKAQCLSTAKNCTEVNTLCVP
jgi:uncharacterized protein YbbC (DUF1343 family)